MIKRTVALLLGLFLLLPLYSNAYAITVNGCVEEFEFEDHGFATFILDEGGKVVGALKADEDLGKIEFQTCKYSAPRGLEDGRALRRRKFARVELGDDLFVLKGGTEIECTIRLTDAMTVQEIVGYELSVETIIDATIYSPYTICDKTYAGHMFMSVNSNRFKVGTVYFCNGTNLELYAGNFDCDSDLELGFLALATKAPEPQQPPCDPPLCPPCPCHNCYPCPYYWYPCNPYSYNPYPQCQNPCDNSVAVTTVTTTTTTTTTVVSKNGC